MDPRRSWLLAGVVPASLACAVAASSPALRPLGDLAVAASGLIVAALVWVAAARRGQSRTGWRLLALAPLPPVAGTVLAAVVVPSDPLEAVTLRWALTVPGYLLAIVGILLLVERRRLLAAGWRLAVESALFTAACLVIVQFLMAGPFGGWVGLGVQEQVLLYAAVVASSGTMAATLALLGTVEAPRQPAALVLLACTTLLIAGRGIGTSALLAGAPALGDVARFFVVAGLWMLALAVVTDQGRCAGSGAFPVPGRSTELGQVLPHLAMLMAVLVTGALALSGTRPSAAAIGGVVVGVALAALHRWITVREVRAMAARLRRREACFRSLVRSSSDAVVILDDRLLITPAAVALERVLGTGAADLVGRPLLDVVHPDDRASLAAALPTAPADGTDTPGESDTTEVETSGLLLLRLLDGEGVWRCFEAGVTDLRSDPDVGAVVLHCRDMTERHAREQALLGVAYTDPSTGLPNRAGFLRALEVQLDRGDPVDEDSTIMMIELDGLAAAREQVGRLAATAVESEIGRRLRATVRGGDVVARLGGGAFAVLAHGERGEAERLAARLLSVVEQPVVTDEGIVDLTAEIGLVTVEGDSIEELLHRADLAVRAAHEAGPGTARRYEPALGEAADRRDRLRVALQSAVAEHQLFLTYQPVVALDHKRIIGIEAQLRWRHPELGEVPPAEFLPLAERAGLISDLIRWALQEVTAFGVGLPGAEDPLKIGLKVPTGYAATGMLVPDLEVALRGSGLAPDRLVLEISSAAVATDDERIGLDLATVRLMGVHVALQGFGSGDSTLAHLTRIAIDIVKLDRALITRIDRDPQSRALCESIIGIARALGLDSVAEGVETPAQLAALVGFGCGFAQGFHIARPVNERGLVDLLRDNASLWPGSVASR